MRRDGKAPLAEALAIVAAFALAVCDGDGPFGLDARSGRRVKAQAWQPAEDGVSFHAGLHDAELGIECSLVETARDDLRCAPALAQGETRAFADAGCTRPMLVIHATASGEDPGLVALGTGEQEPGCPPSRVYARSTGRRLEEYFRAGRGCMRVVPERPAWEGQEVPADVLAHARVVRGREVQGIAPLAAVTDDGARIPFGWEDTARGARCTFALTTDDGVLRCRPLTSELAVLHDERYADAACSKMLVEPPPACRLVPPRVAYEWRGCTNRWTTIDPAVSRIYHRSGAGCVTSGATPEVPMQGEGETFPPEAFPPGERIARGKGRIKARGVKTAAGTVADQGAWDDVFGMPCDARQASPAAAVHCEPASFAFTAFADEACTQPLVPALPCAPPAERPRVAVRVGATDATPPVFAVYDASDPHSGPFFARMSNGTCVPLSAGMQPLFRVRKVAEAAAVPLTKVTR